MRLLWIGALPAALVGTIPAAAGPPPSAGTDFFETKVRPLLAQRCLTCHSGAAARGGLALDSRAGWQKGGASGPALVPGSAANSLLLQAIRHAPGVPAMPPGIQLPDAEIAVFANWIQRGAPDPRDGHQANAIADRAARWALQPLSNPVPPKVKATAWVRTPIDRFILAKLEAKGLHPAPEANRRTLLRRVTYDLIGLPPTPQETAAFLADTSPYAYEKVVDRLLASSHYGERWGRHWLDVVHYGDTHGYDKDKRRDNAWPYRDYVIDSLNQDKPYSRFIQEQVAGDVLFPDRPEGVIATGFLAAGPWDFVGNLELREGTVEKEKTRLLDRDDMVASTISTFDSMTIHCARCHDHKFDPIPQQDYYRLQAVFAGIERGDRPRPDPALDRRKADLDREQSLLTAQRTALEARIDARLGPALAGITEEITVANAALKRLPAPPQKSGSPTNGYHSGIEATPDVVKWVQVDLGRTIPIDVIRLLPARPTDFADTPGFGFPVQFRVEVCDEPTFAHPVLVDDQTAVDVANPGDAPALIPAKGKVGRYVRVTATRLWKRTGDYIFALAEMQVFSQGTEVAHGGGVTALDSIESGRWAKRNLVDGFDSRNALPDLTDPAVAGVVRQRDALQIRLAILERARQSEREAHTEAADRVERARLPAQEKDLRTRFAALPPASMVYGIVSHAPRPIFVLARGEVEQKGAQVRPGALNCVENLESAFANVPLDNEGAGRAALAQWITSPHNPLTWRSIVNRVWHYHFGRGIVDTPNDFGKNGSRPTHPELLDWLAQSFLANGQSMKKLHRLIVLSATYRQSSAPNPVGSKLDADNRLLWRMNRRRLEAEEIRDTILAVSGKLDTQMGGPGFELFHFKDDHSPIYDYTAARADDPSTFRRSVYQFTVRSVPYPLLDSLDSADPNTNTPVRNTTLTALQALALRNDPFILRQAEYFAERLSRFSPELDRQIEQACLLTYGRGSTASERTGLTTYARKYGLANTCRLLLNTNEFVFLD
jgi:hypothetical protein